MEDNSFQNIELESPTTSQQDFFQQLPLELRCQIFSYLPGAEVLQCLFLSHYFYETIKYGPGAISSLDVPILKNGRYIFFPNDTKFCLSVVTDRRQRSLQGLRIVEYFATYNEVGQFLSNYNIRRLHLSETCSVVLTAIRQLGPFTSLQELRFGFEMPLDLNSLQGLSELTPNLEALKIDFYYGLSPVLYKGEHEFAKLKSLRISTDSLIEMDDFFGRSASSPDSIISSFLLKTPNLTKLALLGVFFEKRFKPTISFVGSLHNLNSLGLEISEDFDITGVPPIKQGNTKLSELYIKCRKNVFTLPQVAPLIDIETFYFDGFRCGSFLGYYGIGDNLKNLFLRPYGDIEDRYFTKELSDLCKRCPMLETLVVLSRAVPVNWLEDIATSVCLYLKVVSFYSFARQKDGYNVELLSGIDNIRDIYLYERLPSSDIDWLLDHGFNIYHGSYYAFDVFNKNPFIESNFFLT